MSHDSSHANGSTAVTDIVGVDLGKRLMRNRKPVNVKAFAMAHNLVMFLASLYMVIETLRQVSTHPTPLQHLQLPGKIFWNCSHYYQADGL